ncbi:MAG: hypothetical protein AMXMBFR53_32580 [Gemmatimonadota bacterium]
MKKVLPARAAVLPFLAVLACAGPPETEEEVAVLPGDSLAAPPAVPAQPAEVALEVAEDGLLERARVSDGEARAIVLRHVGRGRITSAGLGEAEGRLVYAYEVAREGSRDALRIQVDAATGAVSRVGGETP